jgi:hypothetical protein
MTRDPGGLRELVFRWLGPGQTAPTALGGTRTAHRLDARLKRADRGLDGLAANTTTSFGEMQARVR